MGKRKAPTISVSELRSAVDKSVKRLKEDIRLQGSFATHQGVIFGRVLQDEVDLDIAEAAATTITTGVSVAAGKAGLSALSPVVLKVPGRTIIGFVEESMLRQIVE
jgi:hypothetical protein